MAGDSVLGVLEGRGVTDHTDHGLNVREVDVEGFGGNEGYAPVVDAAVGFLALGKRGESPWVLAIAN